MRPGSPDQCPSGQTKVDGKHCCPRGYSWDGKCYPPSNGGGSTPPNCKGVLINGVCLDKLPIFKQPKGQDQPQVSCKRGQKLINGKCVSDTPAPTTPGLILKKQLIVPNLQIFKPVLTPQQGPVLR